MMLIVEKLEKSYQGRAVLKGVSFRINPGEIVALAGSNGAGKSTLIKSILGLIGIQGGRVAIGPDGVEPGSMAARRLVTYVPEQPFLYNDLTAWEHLQYVAMLHGLTPQRFAERGEHLLRTLGLWTDRHLDPLQMSKGMKQKLSLASALLPSPRLLLLDEPFSGLDPMAARSLRELILAVRSDATAVLMSTHMLETAERISDRFLLLYDGQLVGDGKGDELRRLADLPEDAPMEDLFAELCARRVER